MTATTERVKLLPSDEALKLLPISKATLYTWMSRKKGPPAVKIGSRLFFREDQLTAWIDAQPTVGGCPMVAA